MDNAIYLSKLPELGSKCKPMRIHLSIVARIDFSMNGNYL